MRGLLVGLALVVGLFAATAAMAEQRVALVVGNSAYESVPTLPNPDNDATAIAEKLKSVGFTVLLRTDLKQAAMTGALGEFAKALDGADVGLFYYAGHGVQFDGHNYLISTDAQIENEFALNSEATSLDQILDVMQRAAPINLVLLDACRNNPFIDRLSRSLPARRALSVSRGLAPVDVQHSDTMIVYATAANQTALDGAGAHSPFAQALLDNLDTPDVEVSLLLKRVVQEVRQATSFAQNPEVLSAMAAEFYFAGRRPAPEPPGSVPTVPAVAPPVTVATLAVPEAAPEVARTSDLAVQPVQPETPKQPGSFDTTKLATLDVDAALKQGDAQTAAIPSAAEVEQALGLRKDDVIRIQTALVAMGYDLGDADGSFGKNSRDALRLFQVTHRVPQTGYLDGGTIDAILKSFAEAPKNYDGKWNLEIRRQLVKLDPGWPGMKVGDSEHLMSLDVHYANGEFLIDHYSIVTVMPDEPFYDFSAAVSKTGLVTLTGHISTHFRDANNQVANMHQMAVKLQLPKIMPYERTVAAEGNRFEPPIEFVVKMTRVKG